MANIVYDQKLFLVVNVDWFFLSHRLPIALEAKKRGYDVTIFTIDTGRKEEIESYGFRCISLPTSRAGTQIWNEFKVVWFLYSYYKKEKPNIVHHVAVKPVTYGSLAAKYSNVPKVVNALSGLGFLYINAEKNRVLHKILNIVFRYSFANPNITFILQNHDDFKMIHDLKILKPHQIKLIKGSGVDLDLFSYHEEMPSEKIKVVLPARMLWDKGVGEFVEAAKHLYTKYGHQAEFILAGESDMGNKSGISAQQLDDWSKNDFITWIGFQKDIKGLLKNAHIIVLPSYREGLPKSLIEACAIGRPIVTTDVPGCREVVKDGLNGFLVSVKDFQSLSNAIEKLILDRDLRIKMGKEGRKLAEREFSIDSVLEKTFEIYNS
jgi:glycosyltransferase involved in cell wall biosynthesis